MQWGEVLEARDGHGEQITQGQVSQVRDIEAFIKKFNHRKHLDRLFLKMLLV